MSVQSYGIKVTLYESSDRDLTGVEYNARGLDGGILASQFYEGD